MSEPFVHLHVHTQYSLLESSLRIDEALEKAKEYNQPALAMTDHGNMFGAIEFYLTAKKMGVKPIIGCEVYIAPESRLIKGGGPSARNFNPQSLGRLVLLAQNKEGYHNLCQLVSLGYTEGFYYKPRVDYEILEKFSQNLIALTSSPHGDVPATFTQHGAEKALEKIKFYKKIFNDRFYLEIQRNGSPAWNALEPFLIEAGKLTHTPIVATNDIHYLNRDESFAHEILMGIQSAKSLLDDKRPKMPSDQFYFRSSEEMAKLFKDIPHAIDETSNINDRINLEFKFTDQKGNTIYHLPTFPSKDGRLMSDEIRVLSEAGLNKRFEEMASRGETVPEIEKPRYVTRLNYELDVINRMGFNGYFLIVQDFINYAKDNGIPVGPGRGSGAGSLVAYSLRVTDLDPLRYNLLFERFLNPERISMPDFDVDFCQDRRGEVIKYVTEKYGAQCVAQIITFGKLQARAAIRDVGRAMGVPYPEVDFIAKLIPEKLGITLDEAIKTEPKLQELADNDPKISSLLQTALKLEGLTRHASIHAAGVIISDKPLVEHCPLYKGNEGETVIQYDMNYAEKIGLIKFDFLGLKTLTMIDNAIKFIRANRVGQENLSTSSISLSDPKIYDLLSSGDTDGVFQFEGDGISDLIRRFKPNCFEDITAINALYRPGPMNMLDEYVARKHGKIQVSYLFPQLEEVLNETYGIIVYQEQVQLIAARLANYSLGEADILRRAMGKKKPEEMARQRERFLKGCAENNLDPKKAGELFDLMAKFAEYGFNKSHAAAYCVVAAHTAYLKAYFPVEFYASLITTEMSDTDKIVKYIRDARDHKINVRGPDVNRSVYKFIALGDEIVFGLGGIKGVGEAAVEAIVEARNSLPEKKFATILEFFENVDLRRVNKRVIECLIKAGAFDSLHSNRSQLYTGFEKFLDVAEKTRKDKEMGQVSIFDLGPIEEKEKIELPTQEEWPRSIKLAQEKEVLGFYISDHPLSGFESVLKNHVNCTIAKLFADKPFEPPVVAPGAKKNWKEAREAGKKKVQLGGIVTGLKEFITKKGKRMAFAQLEDQTGVMELVIFPDTYTKFQELLKSSQPLLVTGSHEQENDQNKILAEDFKSLANITSRSRELIIRLDGARFKREDITKLAGVLSRHRGELKSRVEVWVPELKAQVTLELDAEYNITPSEAFFEDLERQLGSNSLATLA